MQGGKKTLRMKLVLSLLGFSAERWGGSDGCCWSGRLAAAESQDKQNRAKTNDE